MWPPWRQDDQCGLHIADSVSIANRSWLVENIAEGGVSARGGGRGIFSSTNGRGLTLDIVVRGKYDEDASPLENALSTPIAVWGCPICLSPALPRTHN